MCRCCKGLAKFRTAKRHGLGLPVRLATRRQKIGRRHNCLGRRHIGLGHGYNGPGSRYNSFGNVL